MPLTLAEHVQAQTEPIKKGVFIDIVRESVVGDLLSWNSTGSLTTTGVRYDGVILPEWVAANQTIPEKTVQGKNLSYGIYQMAVHMDIPNPYERDKGVVERPSTRQMRLASIGAATMVNYVFVNGSQAADPNQPEGIEQIVSNLGTNQNIGGTEIDLTGTPTDDEMYSFFERIDEAIHAVDGHKPDFALGSGRGLMAMRNAMRRLKLPGDTFDWVAGKPFGNIRSELATAATKPMLVYQGVPFYDIGDLTDETGARTPIIRDDYAEGGSSKATRFYFVKQGGLHLEGLQYAPLDLKKIADTLHDKDVARWRLTWSIGFGVWKQAALSVARGIKVVA